MSVYYYRVSPGLYGINLVERSLKGLMQGSLRNYDGENCVSMGLCRIVSELVNYSFFPAVSEKPANNFLAMFCTRVRPVCVSSLIA